MKLLSTLAVTSVMTLFIQSSAVAQTSTDPIIGQLDNVSGNVLVERNGEFLRTNSDSAVIANDRIITLDGASTNLSYAGCNLSVPVASSVTIQDGHACSDIFIVSQLEAGDLANNASLASLEIVGGTSAIITILAAAGLVAGIVVVADDDDDDDDDVSP